MEPSYSRRAKLDGPTGYKTFAKAWDLQVANMYSASVAGDTSTQRIRRKSYVQLQEHHDNLKRHKELLAESASMHSDDQMKKIERVFKDTRRQLQPHQSATPHLTNITYNPSLGRAQFGVPMALNTTIAAGAFQHNPTNNGPAIMFRTVPLRPAPSATRSSLGNLFKSNKYCWRCGYQKKIHVRSGTSFGDKCTKNCGYEQCSKCNERVSDCHSIGFVGPHCPKEATAATQDTVNDWWKNGVQTGNI